MKIGFLFNKHSWWIGVHYSPHNRRWCINLLPCLTIWIVRSGGIIPVMDGSLHYHVYVKPYRTAEKIDITCVVSDSSVEFDKNGDKEQL